MTYLTKLEEMIGEEKTLNQEEMTQEMRNQLIRLENIILSKHNQFFVNGNDYAVYLDCKSHYNMNGQLYTLDVKKLCANFNFYYENWYIPTLEGAKVDIWLI